MPRIDEPSDCSSIAKTPPDLRAITAPNYAEFRMKARSARNQVCNILPLITVNAAGARTRQIRP